MVSDWSTTIIITIITIVSSSSSITTTTTTIITTTTATTITIIMLWLFFRCDAWWWGWSWSWWWLLSSLLSSSSLSSGSSSLLSLYYCCCCRCCCYRYRFSCSSCKLFKTLVDFVLHIYKSVGGKDIRTAYRLACCSFVCSLFTKPVQCQLMKATQRIKKTMKWDPILLERTVTWVCDDLIPYIVKSLSQGIIYGSL